MTSAPIHSGIETSASRVGAPHKAEQQLDVPTRSSRAHSGDRDASAPLTTPKSSVSFAVRGAAPYGGAGSPASVGRVRAAWPPVRAAGGGAREASPSSSPASSYSSSPIHAAASGGRISPPSGRSPSSSPRSPRSASPAAAGAASAGAPTGVASSLRPPTVVQQGALENRTGLLGRWQLRYFVLMGGRLLRYRSREAFEDSKPPSSSWSIDALLLPPSTLAAASNAPDRCVPTGNPLEFTLAVRDEAEILDLRAKTFIDVRAWVTSIQITQTVATSRRKPVDSPAGTRSLGAAPAAGALRGRDARGRDAGQDRHESTTRSLSKARVLKQVGRFEAAAHQKLHRPAPVQIPRSASMFPPKLGSIGTPTSPAAGGSAGRRHTARLASPAPKKHRERFQKMLHYYESLDSNRSSPGGDASASDAELADDAAMRDADDEAAAAAFVPWDDDREDAMDSSLSESFWDGFAGSVGSESLAFALAGQKGGVDESHFRVDDDSDDDEGGVGGGGRARVDLFDSVTRCSEEEMWRFLLDPDRSLFRKEFLMNYIALMDPQSLLVEFQRRFRDQPELRQQLVLFFSDWVKWYPCDFGARRCALQQPAAECLRESSTQVATGSTLAKQMASIRQRLAQVEPFAFLPSPRLNSDLVCADIVELTPVRLAHALCLVHTALFEAIHVRELSNRNWTRSDVLRAAWAPTLTAFIQDFNEVSLWIGSEILRRPKPALRTQLVVFFIQVADECRVRLNLHGAVAVLAGLQLTPIYRLKATWNGLPSKWKERFADLRKLFAPTGNYSTQRQLVDACARSKKAAIPHLAVVMKDLFGLSMLDKRTDDGKINWSMFSKQWRSASRDFVELQQLCVENEYAAQFDVDQQAFATVQHRSGRRILSDEEMLTLSGEWEPKESSARRAR